MKNEMTIRVIARIYNDYKTKFGIPRQSGLANSIESYIVFEKEYRDENCLRAIEEFSHLWLIWGFSENEDAPWRPTVRPPRLGGNKRIGVFATRSPFRPNKLGLSSVRLLRKERTENNGTILVVIGADLLSGTPIYDIKPYISYTDMHEDSYLGFADIAKDYSLCVEIADDLIEKIAPEKRSAIVEILKNDPRPAYQNDSERIYGITFSDYEIKFKVQKNILTVTDIINKGNV